MGHHASHIKPAVMMMNDRSQEVNL